MSKNQDVQEKLQEEVDQAFVDCGGKFPDYNTIQNLPYVDMVIHETLRHFNTIGITMRACTKEYQLPGTDLVLKRNDLVSFIHPGIHKDPRYLYSSCPSQCHHGRYYSNPEEFYPEHFSKEEKANRSP